MDDLFSYMLDKSREGFYCGQILLMLALESEGKENPDLVRAMGGVTGGLGFCGKTCGALIGGCCLIGYYCSKGDPEELEDSQVNEMIAEFVRWFEDTYGKEYGGIDCNSILQGDPANRLSRCPDIIAGVYEKVMEMLEQRGYDV